MLNSLVNEKPAYVYIMSDYEASVKPKVRYIPVAPIEDAMWVGFLQKSIKLFDKAIGETRKAHPALFSEQ